MHGSTRLALVLWLAGSLLGCAVHPRYESRVVEAQKDVLLVIVSVPARLNAAGYREVAEQEIQKLLEVRSGTGVPLYEVRFEFLGPRGEDGREIKYASFAWRSPELPSPAGEFVTTAEDDLARR